MKALKGMRVLVGEDNFLVAEGIRYSIEEAGGTVIATQGNAVLLERVAKSVAADCAVLDVELASGTCVETAGTLTARHVPFVIVTGYDRSWLPNEIRDAPYLSKPFEHEALISTLAAAARHSRPTR
jgi:AmiR/NasT family two-component response regulator